MQDKFEKFMAQQEKNKASAGKALVHTALGHAVTDLLEQGKEPTRDNLIEALKTRISETLSAKGQIKTKIDLGRAPLEYALALLEPRSKA